MKYTIENPKKIEDVSYYKPRTFTGVVKDKYGNIAYYEKGKFHRADGPAIISINNYKYWFFHGKQHRGDGPAVELPNGGKVWYYNDKRYGNNNDFTVESWIKKWGIEVFK